MLACFPPLLPDELVPYSPLARLNHYMGYSRVGDVVLAAYGTHAVSISAKAPDSLNRLIANLPPNHEITLDRLLNDHTNYPLYALFMDAGEKHFLRDFLAQSASQAAYDPRVSRNKRFLTNHLKLPAPHPKFLRYCHDCLESDHYHFGESYWHRLHQVPGVEVCPSHSAFLLESNVPYPQHRLPLLRVPRVFEQSIQVRRTEPENRWHSFLIALAREVKWALENPIFPSQGSLFEQYEYALSLTGIRMSPRLAAITELSRIVERELPDEFLKRMGTNWFYQEFFRLFDPITKGKPLDPTKLNLSYYRHRLPSDPRTKRQPLHHLIMIIALGFTAEEFFTLPGKLSPLNEGKWPCLNRFCRHYRITHIDECEVKHDHIIIRCPCGFAYTRKITNQKDADPFIWHEIFEFGSVWLAGFLQLWSNPSSSIDHIALQLNLHPECVRRVAQRLRLSVTSRLQELAYLAQNQRDIALTCREREIERGSE
jgi:hypothetical protein